ncbi:uncharacterized protein SEPMUDRAFT_117850 [Sphaerulina musiva SO2202]|uniref:Putative gamma-glutamylcyclotransferase n=1 Tax=Sphaerulina musiva (strain SO2202) TaxID=692275 RepID=N1QF69_SPHMS|nr:uncharacterized protein SEPMUDRAFT_117850 [Sphaerulina musiva SO2202]EMF11888.1 hypothetical protein SEPMUDRAFT_117850 [Sphaerulina musiva SO2202]
MATTSPETANVTTPPAASPQEQGRAAFFYGTLMAPAVLHRVCHGPLPWNPSNPHYSTHNFKTYPAILPNHIRKRVVFADYPGVIPSDGESVRGVYVTGLTASDISRLDTFEGDEYTRQKVSIRLLQEEGDEKKNSSGEGGNSKLSAETGEKEEKEEHLLPCETYIWTSHPSRLENREWDFAEFVREKQHKWVGSAGDAEYAGEDTLQP